MRTKNITVAFSAVIMMAFIITTSSCGNASNRARDPTESQLGIVTTTQNQSAAISQTTNQFSTANLTGKWHVWLIENGNPGRGWVYMVVNINPAGKLTCTDLWTNAGSLACQDYSPLPDISLSPEGLISFTDTSIYGILDYDGSTAYLEEIDAGMVVKKGVMTRVENNITMDELSGNWTMLLPDNNSGSSSSYLKMYLAPSGEMTCLEFVSSNGVFSCPPLPAINIDPSGILYSDDFGILGLLNYDRTSGTVVFQSQGEALITGTFTRTSEDFITADLKGLWTIMLLGEANSEYARALLVIEVNEFGNATCLQYLDSAGSTTCPSIGALGLDSDGVLHVTDTPVPLLGIMDHDRTTAHLISVGPEGLDYTGVMTKTPSDFGNSNLIGTWTAIVTENGNDGFGWAFMEVTVDDLGEAVCVNYVDSDGSTVCPQTTVNTITPQGVLSFENGTTLGLIAHDMNSFHIFDSNSNGITKTGTITRKSEDYFIENLTGRWTAFLTGNGNSDFGWVYVEMYVNPLGEAQCINFLASTGSITCSDFSLAFSMQPNGFFSSLDTTVFGLMDYSRDSAKLSAIVQNNVTYTGVMTRSFLDDVQIPVLKGEWTAFLSGTGADGYGWVVADMEIDHLGQTTCLNYLDNTGNSVCPAVSTLAINQNGFISTENSTVYGLLNHAGNSAFIADISAGVTRMSGIMLRR